MKKISYRIYFKMKSVAKELKDSRIKSELIIVSNYDQF